MIVSTYRRLWCLFTCQKYNSLFTSFLRYYILKNPAIWLGDNILDLTREQGHCQIWDWWWNINNNISFHFRLFPRKSNDKVFQKIQKKPPILGQFGALFAQIWAKTSFPRKKGCVSFRYSNYLQPCQKSEETNEPLLRKTPNWQTDRQRWLYGTLRKTGVQQYPSPISAYNCSRGRSLQCY